jgi:hypothetical protein
MRNVSYLLIMSLGFAAAACGGGGDGKSSGTAKKAGPKEPKKLTTKPANAQPKEMGTTVKAPGGSGGQSLSVPGGETVQIYEWQEAIDESGNEAECAGAFTDDGSAVVACSPLVDTCDDGSELDADLLIAYDASQGYGAFAIVGSDLCGEGYDLIGCTFDDAGNIGDCGTGSVDGSDIYIDSGSGE